jgi:uncharacterized membrane protein
MPVDPAALVAILGMAAVTYLTRVGGLWLMARIPTSGRLDPWLRALPGAVLISLVAPAALAAGAPGWIGVAVSGLVAARGGGTLLAAAVGMGLFALLRVSAG